MSRHVKLVILFVVCILSISQSWGQSQALVGKVYVVFSDQITVYGLNDSGSIDEDLSYTAKGGTKFSVVGFDEKNNILITFWRYPTIVNGKPKYDYSSKTIKKAEYFYFRWFYFALELNKIATQAEEENLADVSKKFEYVMHVCWIIKNMSDYSIHANTVRMV